MFRPKHAFPQKDFMNYLRANFLHSNKQKEWVRQS